MEPERHSPATIRHPLVDWSFSTILSTSYIIYSSHSYSVTPNPSPLKEPNSRPTHELSALDVCCAQRQVPSTLVLFRTSPLVAAIGAFHIYVDSPPLSAQTLLSGLFIFMLTPLRSRRRLCSNHLPEEGALVSGVSYVSPTTSWPPGSCR